MTPTTSRPWPPPSTADRARRSVGERLPRLSTPCCDPVRLVLRRPIESGEASPATSCGIVPPSAPVDAGRSTSHGARPPRDEESRGRAYTGRPAFALAGEQPTLCPRGGERAELGRAQPGHLRRGERAEPGRGQPA